MRHWYTAKEFKSKPFDVIIEWTYEDAALGDMFDETVFDLETMIDRCNKGIDTHYITRVRYMYNKIEMGCSTLVSCYAADCTPEEDIEAGLAGYLEDMMDEAESEARERAVELSVQMKEDFLS